MRTCIECKTEQEISCYGKNRNMPDGIHRRCRTCVAARTQKYREANRELVATKNRERQEARRAESAARAEARRNDPERLRRSIEVREAAKERARARARLKYAQDREKYRQKWLRWRNNNPEAAALSKRRCRQRLADRPEGVLNNRMSSRLYKAVRRGKAGRSWCDVVDYSVAELMAHLERQFLRGMSWENMGEWHIDHIVPLASFSFDSLDDGEFKRAWALTNLRPLWARDNIRKGSRIQSLL